MTTELQPTALLVEDDITTAQWYKRLMENESVKLDHVETGAAAMQYLQQTSPTAILLDLGLPDMNGIDILKHLRQQQFSGAVIVIAAEVSIEIVVNVMRYGAVDFITKPVEPKKLIGALRGVFSGQYSSYPTKMKTISTETRQQYHQLIGGSAPMQAVYKMIGDVAATKATILITGENGTGKEPCADALHKESQRADQPFIVFDCAAVSKELMGSQLFGHVKGAFTGAISDRQGAAKQADGGTLFLDEIGEMPLELQSTLLRFMQTKTFRKVGSDKLERVDVRFICATNRDLEAEVQAKGFRKDLYYRINVVHIQLPALRSRGDDILLLAQTFLSNLAKFEGKPCRGLSTDAQKVLLNYQWPGNVRQLENVIYRALLTIDENEMITSERLGTIINKKHSYEQYPPPVYFRPLPKNHRNNSLSPSPSNPVIPFVYLMTLKPRYSLKPLKSAMAMSRKRQNC